MSDDKFRKQKESLNSIQYEVTQNDATEPPFQNAYWDNEEEGLYVDIVSNEALFLSKDKFDAGCGWPSFDKTISQELTLKKDTKLGYERVEVRSKEADSHLGHVFNDGPTETGLRFCINSASLRFIPKDKLEEEGFGDFLQYF